MNSDRTKRAGYGRYGKREPFKLSASPVQAFLDSAPRVVRASEVSMRLLVISDIQGNTSCVRKLCSLEGPSFDAVVVAGDIGDGLESTREVFDLLQHFKCPILYVLGNWDHEIPYDTDFGRNCQHLHLKPFQCGSATFVGFSGCDANWGLNPILDDLTKGIRAKYRKIIERREKAELKVEPIVERITASHEAAVAALAARTRDRRKSAYRKKIARLESRREDEIYDARWKVSEIQTSAEWQMYRHEEQLAWQDTPKLNRQALAKVIAESALDPQNTVIVTHQRLYKTVEDFPGIALCIFGHSGPFADTMFKGTRFLNASALDRHVSAYPEHLGPDGFGFNDVKNLNYGNYSILVWSVSGEHQIRCVKFDRTYPGWVPVEDFFCVGNPFVE